MNDLPGQTRQGLQAGLDSAVQQTSDAGGAGEPRGGLQPVGLGGRPVRRRLRRAGPVHDRPAGRGLRVPRHAAPCPSPAAPADGSAPTDPDRAPVRDRGHEPHRRRRCAAVPLGCALPLGPAVSRHGARSRQPSRVGLGDRTRSCGRSGAVAAQVDLIATSPTLAPTHNVVLRTVRLNPPALPTPQGAPSNVSVLSPTSQLERDGGRGQRGNGRRAARRRSASRWRISPSGATATRVETAGPGLRRHRRPCRQVTFGVKPGTAYVLTVQVLLPPGQTQTAGTVVQQPLQVAPAT